ncbi:MAG TPA: tetratricopeptide repeat protein [Candidatus Ozemobacteraceae bacterium]|nr:tetratricopeptide repeat protein [Candidatus Ozemobacteraceae bacterium]
MDSLKLPLILLVLIAALTAFFFTQPKGQQQKPGRATADSRSPQKTEDLVRKAEAALDRNAFEEVVAILEPVSSNEDPAVQSLLGYAHAGLKNFDAAVSAFEKALEKKRDIRFGYALAYTLESMGAPERAATLYRDLTTAPLPKQLLLKVHQGLARCSLVVNDPKTALDSYKYIIQEDATKLEPFIGILKLMKAAGTSKGLDKIRERGDLLHSKNYSYCYWIGSVHFEAGEYDKALEMFRACVKLDQSNSSPYYYIYRILRKSGKTTEALQELERFHALNPNLPYIFFEAAIDAKAANRPDIAFKFLRTAFTMDRGLLGRDDQGTIAAVEKFVKTRGTAEEKAFLKPFLAFINSEFSDASRQMRTLLPSLKTPLLRADAERLIAEADVVLKRESAYNAYLAKANADRNAAIAALRHQLESRRTTASEDPGSRLDDIKRAALNNPRDAKLQYATALKLARAGDIPGAKLFLNETLRANPGISEAHYSLAKVLHFEGNHADAVAQLQQAIRIKPADSQSRSLLAAILLEDGETDKAEQEARSSLLNNPNNGEARLVLAQALAKSDRRENALEEIAIGLALETDPERRTRFVELQKSLREGR